MSACLRPISIKVDRRKTYMALASCDKNYVRYRDVRPSMLDRIDVPCGKCINCLKNRQNALVSRCLEESEKRGTFVFLTLTYDDEHLPIAQSLWRVSKSSGECELVDEGEVIVSARSKRLTGKLKEFKDDIDKVRQKFNSFAPKASVIPRYVDSYIDGFEDDEYVYFSRLTPSVCRQDVRLWLKNARVNYERTYGKKLSDFTYVAVSEYGPNTCRPHYHLAFFGLDCNEAIWLSDFWKYGYKMVKFVNRVNSDGSNGFQIASRYIGKYMTKGKFDCESVLQKSAERPRICQSVGIGQSLIDKLRSYMCAFDMFGEYDLDTFFCPTLGRSLTDDEVAQLVKEVPNRLVYDVGNDYKLPFPRLFRSKVFYKSHLRREKCNQYKFRDGVAEASLCLVQREVKVPTTLWCLVTDNIRTHFLEDSTKRFTKYCSVWKEGSIFDACSEFAYYEDACKLSDENNAETHYIEFLHKSVF